MARPGGCTPLHVRSVGRVVVDQARDVGEEHRLEVEHRRHLGEAGHARVILRRAGIPLRRQQRRTRDERGEAGQRFKTGRGGRLGGAIPLRQIPLAPAWSSQGCGAARRQRR